MVRSFMAVNSVNESSNNKIQHCKYVLFSVGKLRIIMNLNIGTLRRLPKIDEY